MGTNVMVVVVEAMVTGTVTAVDVLVWKLVSPEYSAVIESLPTGSEVRSSVATPSLKVPVPIEVPSLRNSTVPVGVPAPGLTTAIVAVKVTDWP